MRELVRSNFMIIGIWLRILTFIILWIQITNTTTIIPTITAVIAMITHIGMAIHIILVILDTMGMAMAMKLTEGIARRYRGKEVPATVRMGLTIHILLTN
ncbi:hypothetical protein MMC07_001092 [Pseudocyphellaria aurata]|nr:hypothetical protein [Pseudocyphellaria aurata]